MAAADASGNIGTATFDVQVPHDAKRTAIKDDVLGAVGTAPAAAAGSLAGTGMGSGLPETRGATPTLAGELQLDSRGVFIRWQSAEGQGYRVEYKETLTDPDWAPVGIDLLGTGGVMAVRVPTTVHPQRFYRLRVVNDGWPALDGGPTGMPRARPQWRWDTRDVALASVRSKERGLERI